MEQYSVIWRGHALPIPPLTDTWAASGPSSVSDAHRRAFQTLLSTWERTRAVAGWIPISFLPRTEMFAAGFSPAAPQPATSARTSRRGPRAGTDRDHVLLASAEIISFTFRLVPSMRRSGWAGEYEAVPIPGVTLARSRR